MRKYFLIIGLVLFALILGSIDLPRSMQILTGAKWEYLLVAVLLIPLTFVLKAAKWGIIIQAHEPAFEWRKWVPEGVKYFMIGFSLSLLTPGRAGDFSRAMYLRKDMRTGVAISTVLVDRIIDVGMLLTISALAIIGFAFFGGITVIPLELIGLLLIGFVIAVYVITRKNLVKQLVRPFFYAIAPGKYQERMKLSFNDMYGALQQVGKRKGKLLLAVLLGVLGWGVVIFSTYFMGLAVGIPPALFLFMFLLIPVSNLLDILPISVAGIGTRDAAFIFLLGIFGVTAEMAVAFSVVYLLAGYVLFGAIGALLLSTHPVPMNKREAFE